MKGKIKFGSLDSLAADGDPYPYFEVAEGAIDIVLGIFARLTPNQKFGPYGKVFKDTPTELALFWREENSGEIIWIVYPNRIISLYAFRLLLEEQGFQIE